MDESTSRKLAKPSVRKIINENDLDISEIPASKENNDNIPIVTRNDVEEYIEEKSEEKEEDGNQSPINKKTENSKESIEYSGIRESIGDQMEFSYNEIPHVTHHDLAVSELLPKLKEKLNEKYEVNITYTDILVKMVVKSLKKNKLFNSKLDKDKDEIVIQDQYNIGIATQTESGLMVPVIKQADKKSIDEISKEIKEKSEKARNNNLDVSSMKGSTFTITNIGVLGGEYATPIINHPNTSILAVGEMKKRPVVNDKDEVVAGFTIPFSLSIDHRVVDGADAAKFVNDMKELANNPFLLLD